MMHRLATSNVTLSDGTVIPKGTMTAVSAHGMWDPSIHASPSKWDGYRFYNMRHTPGRENVAQLVSTSPEHLGFGHGQHSCPGRFFASNEVKILMCHVLLKHDFELVEGQDLKALRPVEFGFSVGANPRGRVVVRRREEEVGLDGLDG